MDHIFEQKFVRENQQLQFQIAKLNKQVKQLQETVVGYEQMLNELNLLGSIKTGAEQGYKTKGIVGAAKGAFSGAVRAVKHNIGQATIPELGKVDNLLHLVGGVLSGKPGQTRVSGVMSRALAAARRGDQLRLSAEKSVTDSGRTQPNASPTRLSDVVTARLRGERPPTFTGEPAKGYVNPTDVSVSAGEMHKFARGGRLHQAGLEAHKKAFNLGGFRE